MELSCKRDVNFMYLLEGSPVPDHSTFAKFRGLNFAPCSETIMAEMTNFLYEIGEICGRKKHSIQQSIEKLKEYLGKLKEYTQKIHTCGNRNSYSKTDKDTTFMR